MTIIPVEKSVHFLHLLFFVVQVFSLPLPEIVDLLLRYPLLGISLHEGIVL